MERVSQAFSQRASDELTHGPVYPGRLRTTPNIKYKTKLKISLTACSMRSLLSAKFRASRWENVTDLNSVSGTESDIIDIPYCHYSFAVVIRLYERPENLQEASKFGLLSVHFLHNFVLPIHPQVRELVSSQFVNRNFKYEQGTERAEIAKQWRRERGNKFLRLSGLSLKATTKKMATCNDLH